MAHILITKLIFEMAFNAEIAERANRWEINTKKEKVKEIPHTALQKILDVFCTGRTPVK